MLFKILLLNRIFVRKRLVGYPQMAAEVDGKSEIVAQRRRTKRDAHFISKNGFQDTFHFESEL